MNLSRPTPRSPRDRYTGAVVLVLLLGIAIPLEPAAATHDLMHLTMDCTGCDPACSDGRDNDDDGFTDYPNDPGCRDRNDRSETEIECPPIRGEPSGCQTDRASLAAFRDAPVILLHGIFNPAVAAFNGEPPGYDVDAYWGGTKAGGAATDMRKQLKESGWTAEIEYWGFYVCNTYDSNKPWEVDISDPHPFQDHGGDISRVGSEPDVPAHSNIYCPGASGTKFGHTLDTPISHLAYHFAWRLAERFGNTCVNVVAHSMGGVVVRHAVQQIELRQGGGESVYPSNVCVRMVMTLSSPHAGAYSAPACVGATTRWPEGAYRQCWDTQPNSRFINGLSLNLHPEAGVATQWIVAGSAQDGVVALRDATHNIEADRTLIYERGNDDTGRIDHGSWTKRYSNATHANILNTAFNADRNANGDYRMDRNAPEPGVLVDLQLAYSPAVSLRWGCYGLDGEAWPDWHVLRSADVIIGQPIRNSDDSCNYLLEGAQQGPEPTRLVVEYQPISAAPRTMNVDECYASNYYGSSTDMHCVSRHPGRKSLLNIGNPGKVQDPFAISVQYFYENDCGSGDDAPDQYPGGLRLSPGVICYAAFPAGARDIADVYLAHVLRRGTLTATVAAPTAVTICLVAPVGGMPPCQTLAAGGGSISTTAGVAGDWGIVVFGAETTYSIVTDVAAPPPNNPPTINMFSCSPSPAQANHAVSCTVRASDESDSIYYQIAWGDERSPTRVPTVGSVAPGTSVTVSQSWAYGGVYSVSATAIDVDERGSAMSSPAWVSMYINGPPPPTAPPVMTSLSCTPTTPFVGEATSCTFAASDSSSGVAFDVDWGDGNNQRVPAANFITPGQALTATHTWQGAGSHTVTVTPFDNQNPSAYGTPVTRVITVQTNAAPGQPAVSCTPNPASTGTAVVCTFSATDDADGIYYNVDWSGVPERVPASGGVPQGTAYQASRTWTTAGSYRVTVTATDASGLSSLARAVDITVNSPPAPGNAVPVMDALECAPNPSLTGQQMACTFRAHDDSAGIFYLVYWGAGASPVRVPSSGFVGSGVDQSASYAWPSAGDYEVKVTATDDGAPSQTSAAMVKAATVRDPVPSTPSGPASGWPGDSYSFGSYASDPNGRQVMLTFDWGDGTTSSTGFAASGTNHAKSHAWGGAGSYCVRTRATNDVGSQGAWSSCATIVISARPANDAFDFMDVGPSAQSMSRAQSTSGATLENNEPVCEGIGATGWFEWIPSTAGTYRFSTVGSDFDTVLAVYTGYDVHALARQGCVDDVDGTAQSRLELPLSPGTPYRVQVGGKGAATGQLALAITRIGGL